LEKGSQVCVEWVFGRIELLNQSFNRIAFGSLALLGRCLGVHIERGYCSAGLTGKRDIQSGCDVMKTIVIRSIRLYRELCVNPELTIRVNSETVGVQLGIQTTGQ
jgi:hypothetical protein